MGSDPTPPYTYAQKEAAVVTKAPEAKTLTYTGSAQELVTAGTAEGGTMYYALGTATEATEQYTTSIPTATDAGTYYVWYKVKGDFNHNDTEAVCVTASISEPYYPPYTPSTPSPKPTGSITGDSTIPENTFIDPSTTISDEEAKELLTDEEKQAVASGDNIIIYMEAEQLSEAQVPAQDKSAIESQAESNGITVDSYMDISLFKQVNGGTPQKMDHSSKAIEILIKVSQSLIPEEGVTRMYYIFRFHGDTVEIIARSLSPYFTLYSDLFSTYAIGYSDTAEKPVIAEVTSTSISVSAIKNMEYQLDGGEWTTSTSFTGLEPGTTHSIRARYVEGDSVSEPSEAVSATTKQVYKVRFLDGDTVLNEASYEEGTAAAAVTVPEAPEKEGLVFGGWSPEVGDVTADAEYKAVYRLKDDGEGGEGEGAAYLITWCDEDGTILQKEAVAEGTMPEYKGEEPKKEGMEFAGWNPEIAAAVKDTTYTAVYKAPAEDVVFTVSFDADNGTDLIQVSVKSGDPVERPEVPVKAGYTFTGWFNGKKEYDFTKAVKKNLTLVAHWKQESTPAPSPEEPQISTKEAEEAILKAAGDQDMSGATFYKLQARQEIATKKAITIRWKRVPGAANYTIYAARCGQKMKKVAKVRGSKTSYTKRKLQPGKYYKFIVVANGNGKALAVSKTLHIATAGGSAGNILKLKASVQKLSLKAGKSVTIKVKSTKSGDVKKHRSVRLESAKPSVAKISKGGTITAVRKGSCNVYVYAQNGIFCTIKVTVK